MPVLPVMGETEIGDGCVRASSREKLASGIVVYLMEELGDARLRTAQLKKYIQEALDLVEKSPERDRIFEIAGHLLHGIPDTAFKLDKALDAAALAAARLDYEEIKQNLKPEKADELEDVLQDVRLQYLKRRSNEEVMSEDFSKEAGKAQDFLMKRIQGMHDGQKADLTDLARGYLGHFKELESAVNVLKKKGVIDYDGVTITKKKDAPMKNAKEAADELETLAKITETEGKIPLPRLARLIGALEGQGRTASDVPKKASAFFRSAAATIRKETNPSRLRLATVLRRVFADAMQMDAGTMLAAIYAQASSRQDVIDGFMKANPKMDKADAEKAADMWEKHQNVVKDKHQ